MNFPLVFPGGIDWEHCLEVGYAKNIVSVNAWDLMVAYKFSF